MWIVAKIKKKNLNIFKKSLFKKLGDDIIFYNPKIEYHKYFGDKAKRFERYILENYIFCYHDKFKETSSVNNIKFLKGLDYFLEGYNQNQEEIKTFIENCKIFENDKGYLTQSFFKTIISKKAKFISGPFTNMIFEILEKQKNKLKILVGNIVTTIPNKATYLYRPI
mgnify:CR=1 FL=1|jgi:hypothetical protein